MNKNGIFQIFGILTLPIIIALVIGALLLAFGVGWFVSINKYLVIGSAIIGVVLIWLVPAMMQSDVTKEKIYVIVFLVLIGVGIIFIPQIPSFQQTAYTTFLSKDFDIVTVGIKECGWFCKLFKQQTIILPKTVYSPGERLIADMQGGCGGTVEWAKVTITGPASLSIPITPPTCSACSWSIKASFTLPSLEGSYTLNHEWNCPADGGIIKGDPAYFQIKSNAPVSCLGEKFVQTIEIPEYSQSMPNGRYYCNQWEYYTLSGSTCLRSTRCVGYKTVCNTGYIVEGMGTKVADAIRNCVAQSPTPSPEPEPAPAPTPQPDIEPGTNTLCDGDVLGTCYDGSKITLFDCVDGKPVPTKEYCPPKNDGTPNNGGTNTNNNSNGDVFKPSFWQNYGTIVVIGGIVLFLFIMLLVVVMNRK